MHICQACLNDTRVLRLAQCEDITGAGRCHFVRAVAAHVDSTVSTPPRPGNIQGTEVT